MDKRKTGIQLNPFEVALKRPDTFIGSAKNVSKEVWLYNEKTKSVILKQIRFNPGLFNVVREIGSNAIDNKWRSEQFESDPMKRIDFNVDMETGEISIMNDGYCIPVEIVEYKCKDNRTGKITLENMYPAEKFFGDMFTGTNYDDDEERKTSGRNGMGAKAANVFSVEFTVDHACPESKKSFVQTFTENGQKRTEPKIASFRRKYGYTKITFTPDYAYFKFPTSKSPGINKNFYYALKLYAYEMAMITCLPVVFNKERLVVKSLEKYARLFYSDTVKNKMISFSSDDGECVLVEDEGEDIQSNTIKQISFVNGIRTSLGGVHVEKWKSAIITSIVKEFNIRKGKGKNPLKTNSKQLYPFFTLFIRCELDKPSWDSQTKDCLNGPKDINVARPDKAQLTKILKWNFVKVLEERIRLEQSQKIARKEGRKRRVPLGDKGIDANWAGTNKSEECILWITEGDSAKTLAVGMFPHLDGGTNTNGVVPIRGKLLNVSNAKAEQILANKEIEMIESMLGIKPHVEYANDKNRKLLRYGGVNFFTDADDDGTHISALLLLLFYKRYRTLWDTGFFFNADNTPVVKVWKTLKSKNPSNVFYCTADYREWAEKHFTNGMRVKYYKGLGTNSPKDHKPLAEQRKQIEFSLEGDEGEYMSLAFDKSESDRRKDWITRGMDGGEGENVYDEQKMTIEGDLGVSTFIDTQLIIYERMTLVRAIPGIDGFKECHRKIFFTFLKDNIRKTTKVEQAQGSVLKYSGYHHGINSIGEAIIGMAQGFVGKNNIPLLVNDGGFGSRLCGGSDHAAGRYISTYLDPICDFLFPKVDEALLTYLQDDGKIVEPQFYTPIIPMILVNGGEGIASGYSTTIPQYDAEEIVEWIRIWLNGEDECEKLIPSWRGFRGDVEMVKTTVASKEGTFDKVITSGIFEKSKNGWWTISELPIGLWTGKFHSKLDEWSTNTKDKKGKDIPAIISDDIERNSTVNTVNIRFKPINGFEPNIDEQPFKCLKTTKTLSNMWLLDRNGYPRRYDTAEDILEYYCPIRLEFYGKRKKHLLKEWRKDLVKVRNRYKFVKAVYEGELNMRQEDENLESDMLEMELEMIDESFEYLLSMQMRSMTLRKMEELKKNVGKIRSTIKEMKGLTAEDLWNTDLNKFMEEYKKFLKRRIEE